MPGQMMFAERSLSWPKSQRRGHWAYIQAFLGHENLESTQVYTRVSVAQLQVIHARTHPGARSQRQEGDGLPPTDMQGLDLILSDDDDDDLDD